MKKILIDVSEHQGKIDWEKAMYHIDGAILRCGYGSDYPEQDDEQFRRNADECTRLGIPFGVYLYSYAKTTKAAQYEADHVLRLIKDYKLSYPVYLDLEEASTADGAVERAIVFGDIIEKAGYWCGIYANLYWWEAILKKGLERFTKWVAQYYKECEYTGTHLDIWQYTSKGNVPGITGNVDMNECYRDFPTEILGKPEVRPTPKPEANPDPAPLLPPAFKPAAPNENVEETKIDYAESFNKAKAGTYEVTANSGLNLRTGASLDKPVLEVLESGSLVACYGYYTGEWLYVKAPSGAVGFCHGDYLIKL